jgi:hypothetical protein
MGAAAAAVAAGATAGSFLKSRKILFRFISPA